MKKIINIILSLLIIVCLFSCGRDKSEENEDSENETPTHHVYALTNESGVQELDLAFIKITNEKKNELYSPQSIKYALAMLSEGAGGQTKGQLESILNGYQTKKYPNSKNLSLANMFAIKNTAADNVSEEFKSTIKEKYDADFLIETFEDPTTVNKWINEKTLGMIENYIDDYSPDLLFLIVNALAIDMEWINKIQDYLYFRPKHESYYMCVDDYDSEYPTNLEFNNAIVKGLNFASIANKYDIVNEIGESNIRQTVKEDIIKTAKEEEAQGRDYVMSFFRESYKGNTDEEKINNYLDEYIQEIDSNYGEYQQTTDFYFYVDDSIKVFAKDLKEYNNTQFQYIGIMPTKEELSTFIKDLNSSKVNDIINDLKLASYDEYEEGYITEVIGTIPSFGFTYDLNLDKCLAELGITDIFDISKADFSLIVGNNPVSIETSHRSTIEFSNEGIKAAAATIVGGRGAAGSYDYYFDIPTITIDLTFDKPFLFLIRNKDTGDVWFVGTLYEGTTNNAKLFIKADSIRIRKEPSASSEKIGLVKHGDVVNSTGRIEMAEGYTWYEIEGGGWIADYNGEWIVLNWY